MVEVRVAESAMYHNGIDGCGRTSIFDLAYRLHPLFKHPILGRNVQQDSLPPAVTLRSHLFKDQTKGRNVFERHATKAEHQVGA